MENGLWVHKIQPSGGPVRIVEKAKALGAKHIIVKSRDGLSQYKHNQSYHLEPFSMMSRMTGIDFWLWAWVRPISAGKGISYVEDQAKLLAQDARLCNASAVVVNLESPWSWGKLGGGFVLGEDQMRRRAYKYMTTLRDALPNDCKIGVSSFRYPSWHKLPWEEMLQTTEVIGMPQLYFQRKGYAEQAKKSRLQWSKFGVKDIRISGPGYAWKKGMIDPVAFYEEAKGYCSGVDWWKSDGMDNEAVGALQGL